MLPKTLQLHSEDFRVSEFQGFSISGFWRSAGHCAGAGEGRQEAWAAPASILSSSLLLPALAQWYLPPAAPLRGLCLLSLLNISKGRTFVIFSLTPEKGGTPQDCDLDQSLEQES